MENPIERLEDKVKKSRKTEKIGNKRKTKRKLKNHSREPISV